MKIERFQYHNKALEWELEPVSFSDLTLLVGVSGVGKTQILSAVYDLRKIAEGKTLNGVQWNVEFCTSDGVQYQWSGEFEVIDRRLNYDVGGFAGDGERSRDKPRIVTETLVRDGREIATRAADEITFLGQKTPRLSPSSSIIALLSEEDIVRPTSDAFRRIIHSDQSLHAERHLRVFDRKFEQFAEKYDTLEKVQERDLDTQMKLALVYKNHKDVFSEIKRRFMSIFPQVMDVKVEPPENPGEIPIFLLKYLFYKYWNAE